MDRNARVQAHMRGLGSEAAEERAARELRGAPTIRHVARGRIIRLAFGRALIGLGRVVAGPATTETRHEATARGSSHADVGRAA